MAKKTVASILANTFGLVTQVFVKGGRLVAFERNVFDQLAAATAHRAVLRCRARCLRTSVGVGKWSRQSCDGPR